MIIRTGPNRFRSPTALGRPTDDALFNGFNGAGGEALFESFGRYGAIQMPPIILPSDTEALAVQQQMQDAMDEMDKLYWRTGFLLKVFPLDLQTFLTRAVGPAGYFIADEDVSDTAKQVLGTYKQLGQRIHRWKTVLATSVWHEKTPDGDPYDLNRWKALGEVYAENARFLGKLAVSDGFFANVIQSIRELPDDFRRVAGSITNPTAWPTWLKVVGGLAAIVGAAYVVNSFTTAAKVVRGR